MSGEELPLIKEVFESNWIAPLGPMVDAFEKEFSEAVNSGYSAALSSGTAALHLALRLLGVDHGDKVICSSFTFCASVNPIIYQCTEPVFIDSEMNSWNIDPYLLDKEIRIMATKNSLPKAIIIVHLYGQSADMDPILETCNEFNIPVIEDAAEALGAQYKNKQAGSMGRFGIFSFNGNKIITTSCGGMLVSNDEELIVKARFYATQAREPDLHYEHKETGYNYRMSNVLAAIGRGQLSVLQERVKKKREIFEKYFKLLNEVKGIQFMPEPEWSYSNKWLTCITIEPEKFGTTRENVRIRLENHNIESRPLWKPMHMQPVFKQYRMVGGEVSERLFEQGLCLPSGTAMTDDDVQYVCEVIKEMYAERKK
ncbi:DegT/DnrJ/EryC1/StrS family aminotransferase [Candidatus Latescibacterota bacterium]